MLGTRSRAAVLAVRVLVGLLVVPVTAAAGLDFVTRVDMPPPAVGDSGAHSLAIGDFFDSDGVPDLAVSFTNSNVVVLYRNNPPGTLTAVDRLVPLGGPAPPPTSTVSTNPAGLVAVDYFGDALPDLLGVNTGENRFIAYHNDALGMGGWVATDPTADGAQRALDLTVAYWDANLSVDFVACLENGGIRIGLGGVDMGGLPDGTFGPLHRAQRTDVAGVLTDVEVGDYIESSPVPDVLTTDNQFGQLVIWKGHPSLPGAIDDLGLGTPVVVLVPTQVSGTTVKPFEAIPGDWNGDFHEDALVATEEGYLLFFAGTGGAGVFQAPGAAGTVTDLVAGRAPLRQPSLYTAFAYEDLDGDMVRDAILADAGDTALNVGSNWVSVFYGCSESPLPVFDLDGTTCGKPPRHHAAADLTARRPGALGVADLDGVNGPDVILLNGDARTRPISLFFNDGLGGLVGARSYSCGGRWPTGAASLDLTGSGNVDVVVALNPPASITDPAQNTVSVLTSDGAGGFMPARLLTPSGQLGPHSVSLARITGDSVPDIVSSHAGSQVVWPGSGGGAFGAPRVATGIAGEHRVGSLGGTPALDLATVNRATGQVAIRLGDGTGSFATGQTWSGIIGHQDHVVGEFFDGGAADIVIAAAADMQVFAPPALHLIRWDAMLGVHGAIESIAIPPAVAIPGLILRKLALGDLNGDARLDLLAVTGTGEGLIFLNDGADLVFNLALSGWSVNGDPRSLLLADLNADGILDLVTAIADRVIVSEGLPGAMFAAPITLASNVSNDTVMAGDVDGDLRVDLLVTGTNTNDITVFLNRSQGSLILRGVKPMPGDTPADFWWLEQGLTSTFDVLRGDLHELLRLDRSTVAAACYPPEDIVTPMFRDGDPLPARIESWAAWYYLVRCTGAECVGGSSFGSDSQGTARVLGPAACLP